MKLQLQLKDIKTGKTLTWNQYARLIKGVANELDKYAQEIKDISNGKE